MRMSLAEAERVVQLLFRVLEKRVHFQYVDYFLEGERGDLPNTPEAFAVAYSQEIGVVYNLLTLTKEAQSKREEFRQRMLSYQVPAEIRNTRKGWCKDWSQSPKEAGEIEYRNVQLVAEEGLPLFFVFFFLSQRGRPCAVMFQPHDMPAQACLESLQGAVEDAVERSRNIH